MGGKSFDVIKSIYEKNKLAVKIGDNHTDFFPQGWGVKQGCTLSPTLFNIYINELALLLEQSPAPALTLQDTEIKCLFDADDLVILSPTKEPSPSVLSELGPELTWRRPKLSPSKKDQGYREINQHLK